MQALGVGAPICHVFFFPLALTDCDGASLVAAKLALANDSMDARRYIVNSAGSELQAMLFFEALELAIELLRCCRPLEAALILTFADDNALVGHFDDSTVCVTTPTVELLRRRWSPEEDH